MSTDFVNVADFPDPEHPGKTYRQVNAEKQHSIPVGALVEVVYNEEGEEERRYYGVRLYVVQHVRDCDETPIYSLAADRTDTVQVEQHFYNPKWHNGFPEDMLKVIQLP